MIEIDSEELVFRGASIVSPHKMTSKLKLYNPTHSIVFYRVRSTHSVFYSLYVSPVSGKLLPGQSVDIHFVLPSIASVRHSAQPLQFVIQTTVPGPNADLRTFWKYVHFLDVIETPVGVKILPFEGDIMVKDYESSDEDSLLYPLLPFPHKSEEEEVPYQDASCSFEETRNEVVLRLITENRALRARIVSLEKSVDLYDEAMRTHLSLREDNTRMRERLEKLEGTQLPFNCCVCMEEKPNTVVFPCRHVIMCASCATACGNRCPACRSIITSKAIVFF